MPWPESAEVPVVERGQLCLSEALDDREDRSVDEAEREIDIFDKKLAHTRVVRSDKLDDPELTLTHVVEERDERLRAEPARREPFELDHDRCRHEQRFAERPQETRRT